MDGQDWDPVVVKKKAAPSATARIGVPVAVSDMRKVEASDGPVILRRLAPASRTELVQARIALKYDQTKLNQLCSFPKHTIKEIEAGRVCPSPTQLAVLNRQLRISLKYS